jgi:hypothetical protein
MCVGVCVCECCENGNSKVFTWSGGEREGHGSGD